MLKNVLLNNCLKFLTEKLYWTDIPIFIISYKTNENKFYIIFENEERYYSLNIEINKNPGWKLSKVYFKSLSEYAPYLFNKYDKNKYSIIYNNKPILLNF